MIWCFRGCCWRKERDSKKVPLFRTVVGSISVHIPFFAAVLSKKERDQRRQEKEEANIWIRSNSLVAYCNNGCCSKTGEKKEVYPLIKEEEGNKK